MRTATKHKDGFMWKEASQDLSQLADFREMSKWPRLRFWFHTQTSLGNNSLRYEAKRIPVFDEGNASLRTRVARNKVSHFLLRTVNIVASTSHSVMSP